MQYRCKWSFQTARSDLHIKILEKSSFTITDERFFTILSVRRKNDKIEQSKCHLNVVLFVHR